MPVFIRIEFERGYTEEEVDTFMETVFALAEEAKAAKPEDCDNRIWVSSGGSVDT